MHDVLPTAADVADAYLKLRDWVVETPVVENEALNALAGSRVLCKVESLQHSGSFKIRGAMNRLLTLSADERAAGVVAFSSGNHAQAVALAARWLGVQATIVMPSDAPKVKLARTRAHGAEIVLYDRERENREEIAAKIANARGAALVPPFDHPDVIAGQGTLGLELASAVRARRVELEALYVPCSGGGLVAGCALAIKPEFPDCAVFAVEPRGFEDLAASLAAGERRTVAPGGTTLCDGLKSPMPGAITFAVNRRELTGALAVDDDDIRRAMVFAADELKLVLEPSGAAALASVLKEPPRGRRAVGIVLSGGNVDGELFTQVLQSAPATSGNSP
jgi:threonine dehydratase